MVSYAPFSLFRGLLRSHVNQSGREDQDVSKLAQLHSPSDTIAGACGYVAGIAGRPGGLRQSEM